MQKEVLRQVVDRLPPDVEVDVDAFFDQVILLERIEAAERRIAEGLEGIAAWIAKDSPAAANRLVQRIFKRLERSRCFLSRVDSLRKMTVRSIERLFKETIESFIE